MSPVSLSVVTTAWLRSNSRSLLSFPASRSAVRFFGPRLSVNTWSRIIVELDKVRCLGAVTAVVACRHFRVLVAVGMAALGALCVPTQVSSATGQERAAEMLRDGCCCVTKPASGCCCETSTPITFNARIATPTNGSLDVARAGDSAQRRRCPCGRFSDPVAPRSKSQSTFAESESDSGATILRAAYTGTEQSASAFGRRVASRASPPAAPLYIRHARLLI
jgi:hypothetical protein